MPFCGGNNEDHHYGEDAQEYLDGGLQRTRPVLRVAKPD